jgi:alpha-galactosidase
MIGQDIPVLLPTLLTDLLFAGKEPDAELTVEEGNPAMQEVLQGYGDAVIRHAGIGGTLRVTGDRREALSGADCVIYAGDPQAASRFFMDRSALGSDNEEDPGLTDQARVNGGIGGLMHTLRAGKAILGLCDNMDEACPGALVINLGQPVARTTAIFLDRGYRCLGMGRTPMKGANGAETYAKRLQIKAENLIAVTAGLPGFAFLTEIRDGKADMLPKLKKAAEKNELGSLSKRWLGWWDAIPAGDVTDHAEFLPAQPDFIPEEKPEFGESVERRKDRILYMNTVREQGAEAREGAMAQLLLLSKAPPIRPMKLALAVLRGETEEIPAVARRNAREMPQLPENAVIETPLRLVNGEEQPHGIRVPEALAEVLTEIDETNRLAAKAAAGDTGALRECVETDPALGGLDRLYCMDVVRALIDLHRDALGSATDEQ